jgi:hypothetical protein
MYFKIFYFLFICYSNISCEEPSKTYEFDIDIINEEYFIQNNFTNYTSSSNFDDILIGKGIPVIKNLFFKNDNSTFDLLLITATPSSILVNQNCQDCTWSNKKYKLDSDKRTEIVQSFTFGKISGFSQLDQIFIGERNYSNYSNISNITNITNSFTDLNFISIYESEFMNTKIEFSGMLGLGVYKNDSKESRETSFIYNLAQSLSVDKKVGIQYNFTSGYKNGKLYLGSFPEHINTNLTNCTSFKREDTYKYHWTCKMDYILIGDEYDFYLAKNVNQFVAFDSLSYFHIIPYVYLEYFQKSYISANNNCSVVPVNLNKTLHRIECYDMVLSEKIKSLHLILNGWAYRLGSLSLFDTQDMINQSLTKNNTYYFKILFSTEKSGWTIGNGFNKKFMIGYDYDNQKVLFYSEKDRYNFSLYTHENMKEEFGLFLFILISLGLLLTLTIIIIWVIFYHKKREIIRSYYSLSKTFLEENLNLRSESMTLSK